MQQITLSYLHIVQLCYACQPVVLVIYVLMFRFPFI